MSDRDLVIRLFPEVEKIKVKEYLAPQKQREYTRRRRRQEERLFSELVWSIQYGDGVSVVRNTFACAGPDWESVYFQRAQRNAYSSPKYAQTLLPINYNLPLSSLEVGSLTDCEITVCAPGASDNLRHRIAEFKAE